jgi:hypothetical protein
MSRKRSAESGSATPSASKHRREVAGDGETPATVARRDSQRHGRVLLNVGGQLFESSRSTLEGSSSYFQALLARWDEETEPLFLDCDADAFGVLLSHMRMSSNVILPEEDNRLCARVLLLAEYLGMEAMLAKVKATTYRNLHPEAVAAQSDAVAAFDKEVGTLQEAIDSKVLPARFFASTPKPPRAPPERVIKTLIPAPPGYTAVFADEDFVYSEPPEPSLSRDVLSFAVVELRDGSTRVEAIVQQEVEAAEGTTFGCAASPVDPDSVASLGRNHLQFASELLDDGEPWKHHVIIPPPRSTNMLPIAPGTIRGVWAKPAITRADEEKMLTVAESGAIIVGGEVRSATWGDRPIPTHIKDQNLAQVLETYEGDPRSQFRCAGGEFYQVPYLTGSANERIKDITFVEMGRGANGLVPTRFYIADTLGPKSDVYHSNRVVDVTKVKMPNGMQFSHTVASN